MLRTYITVIKGLVTLLVWVFCLYGSQKLLPDYQAQNIHNVHNAYQDRIHSSLTKVPQRCIFYADLSKLSLIAIVGRHSYAKVELKSLFSLCPKRPSLILMRYFSQQY